MSSAQQPPNGENDLPLMRTKDMPDAARILKQIRSSDDKKGESAESVQALQGLQHDIQRKIEFTLATTDKELQQLLDTERKLVIDPAELKREFDLIRQKRASGASAEEIDEFIKVHSRFGRLGSHVSANTLEIMRKVRQNGWAIIAGIWDNDMEFHPVGFNYGLNTMPSGTPDKDPFHVLSKDTIKAHDREKAKIHPEKSAFNWRTGILEEIDAEVLRKAGIDVPPEMTTVSLRRLGIASALKYLIASLAKKNGKKSMYFNIATIYDTHSDERIRNTPSFSHNTRYFQDDLGYRDESTHIFMEDADGNKQKVGEALWRVRGDELDDVLRNLQSEKSVLNSRQWNIQDLERIAGVMYDQLNADGHFGDGRS